MSGRDGNRSVRGCRFPTPPPILPIRKIDDLRMSKSLFDGARCQVSVIPTPGMRETAREREEHKPLITACENVVSGRICVHRSFDRLTQEPRLRPKPERDFQAFLPLNARLFSVRSEFCVFKKTFPLN